MTQQRSVSADITTIQGEVVEVDYDRDIITVRLEDGPERSFPFELFDGQDVYQAGQHFELTLDPTGTPAAINTSEAPASLHTTVSGYVDSIDADDELAWVYLRSDEGWRRKVMPLHLFQENGLARPGRHFLIELDEQGTPLGLRDDEQDLELQPLAIEETKPRWTTRPAAEAEPEQ